MTDILISILSASLLGLLAGSGFGWLGGWLHASRKMRYRDPQLHDGKWEPGNVLAHDVQWRRIDAPRADVVARAVREGTHRHAAALCLLSGALAHEDRCVCGARRYGIFGDWEVFTSVHG